MTTENVIKVYPCTVTFTDHNTRMNPPVNGFMTIAGGNCVFDSGGLIPRAILTCNQIRTLVIPDHVMEDMSKEVFELLTQKASRQT